jgi:hypothetical protein
MRQSGRINGGRMDFSLASKRYPEHCVGLRIGHKVGFAIHNTTLFFLS